MAENISQMTEQLASEIRRRPVQDRPVIIEEDNSKQLLAAIDELTHLSVLVGIPADSAERSGSSRINNATIGYIQETGSPINNIPARPFLLPGVKNSVDKWMPQMEAAGRLALSGKGSPQGNLEKAGTIAATAVQKMIKDGLQPPLAESTVIARRLRRDDIHYRVRMQIVALVERRRSLLKARKAMGLSKEQSAQLKQLSAALKQVRKQYGLKRIYLRKAQTPAEATPLYDTGQLLKSITYVIEKTS